MFIALIIGFLAGVVCTFVIAGLMALYESGDLPEAYDIEETE